MDRHWWKLASVCLFAALLLDAGRAAAEQSRLAAGDDTRCDASDARRSSGKAAAFDSQPADADKDNTKKPGAKTAEAKPIDTKKDKSNKAEAKKGETREAEAKKGGVKKGGVKKGDVKKGEAQTGETKRAGAAAMAASGKASSVPVALIPLARLPVAFELPPLPATAASAAAAVAIGKLDLSPQADCVIYLRGGESNVGERAPRALFHLEEQTPVEPSVDRRGSGVGCWLVFPGRAPTTDAASPSPAVLNTAARQPAMAELRREADQVTFRWLERSVAEPSARQLANCVLEISAAQSRRFVALRKAAKGEPVTFQFQEPILARWDLADAPESRRVKIELRLATKEPRYRFVGSSTLDASQGQTWIEFMDRRSPEALKVKIDCELRGDQLRLQAAAFFQSPGEPKLVRLSPATYKRAVERVKTATAQLEGQLATLAAAEKAAAARGGKGGGAARGKGAESPAEVARKQWEKQLSAARDAANQLDDLADLQRLVDGRSQLLVRAVMDVEGQSVVLLEADKPAVRAGKR